MDNNKKEDYYKLLNVSKSATESDILKAFRHKSREYHPDKNEGCEELMVQLTRAKVTLLDYEKRAKYDDDYEVDDDLSEEEKLFLSTGPRHSDNLKNKLSQWEREFESTIIEDNFDSLSIKPNIVRSADSLHWIIRNIYKLVNNIQDINFELIDKEYLEIKLKQDLALFDKNYKRLNELLYGDNIRDLAYFIKQSHCKTAIHKLYEAYTNGRNIEEYPNKFKATLLLLQGSFCKMSGKYNDSLNNYKEALLLCPSDDMCSAISLLLDSNYIECVIKNLFNDFNSVPKIPEKHEHIGLLKSSPNIRMTTRYEKSVLNNKQLDPFEKAMLYIDLSMAAVDSTVFANNYLIAATYLIQIMEKDCSLARKYALRSLIFDLIVTVVFLTKRFDQPVTMFYFMKFCYILMRKSNLIFREALKDRPANNKLKHKVLLISELQKEMLMSVEKEIVHLIKVTSFTDFEITLSADLIYMDVVTLQFLQNYYPDRIKELKDHPWDNLYYYYQFELTWKTGGEEVLLNSYRENLMNFLLKGKGWTNNEVENLMRWDMINRDDEGWWDIKKQWLNIKGDNYFRVAGVDVEIESGSVRLLLCKCDNGCAGLFGMDDVLNVLWNGVGSSFFTLDQADVEMSSHPFQEMKYAPNHLKNTDFLATLLHADYLLKMFSLGSEVSAKSPFLLRDSTEGLLKLLPQHLREVLKPIHQRKDGHKYGNVHRFWIESKELIYHMEEIEDGVQRFTFDEIQMVVKKHLMKYNSEGVLVDDEDDEDTDTEDEVEDENKRKKKTSPEKQFAKDFTKHYEEIGTYYPVLLRLRELLKLGAISTILRSISMNKQDAIKKLQSDKKPITDVLKKLRKQVNYPVNTNSKVNEVYKKILKDQRISADRISEYEKDEAKRLIRRQLEEADEHILETVAKGLIEGLQISEYIDSNYTTRVKEWLKAPSGWFLSLFFREDEKLLTDYLANSMIQKLSRFTNTLKSMGFDLDSKEEIKWNDGEDCVWVPSAFRREDRVRVYGGVNLQLKMTNGSSGSGSSSIKNSKNSIGYVGPTHVYIVRRVSDGALGYIGISSQGFKKKKQQTIWRRDEFNVSKRGDNTARKLTKSTGELYVAQVVYEFNSRREALVTESKLIKKVKARAGSDKLPYNKRMADDETLRRTAKPKYKIQNPESTYKNSHQW